MRSLLFVPGDTPKKLEKGFASAADVVIIDLEDSVAAANKGAARQIACDFINSHRSETRAQIYIRINDFTTGESDHDLAGIMPARPDGIMLPKCTGFTEVERLSARLRVYETECEIDDGATRIIPIISETAASVLAASSYRSHSRLAGLTWGAEDLSASIGARTARLDNGAYTDVFRLARALTLLASSASEVPAVDTVFPNFRDEDAFRADCIGAERDGFTAKMAIHPAQVAIINEVFTPATEAVAHARAVVDAFRDAGDAGVIAIDGKMYDRPHLKLAERLLARADAVTQNG